jgi:natural product precursor
MKKLGKIHLRTIEEGLSESEMKFVTGGSGYGYGGYGAANPLCNGASCTKNADCGYNHYCITTTCNGLPEKHCL